MLLLVSPRNFHLSVASISECKRPTSSRSLSWGCLPPSEANTVSVHSKITRKTTPRETLANILFLRENVEGGRGESMESTMKE
ncbi:hypothetical protein MLD38_009135 [Melastoma candidum]|uniref:Uncharacterized protein n=1 Tax=Melastoma candidum TaxID=119954 RepID=A0ACB9RW99_9MYRT|nr:hypothetical protein MLD38_009135 [Melastoma candidum]